MTAPAPSPASLQEPSSQGGAAVDKRSRKVYWLWGIGLTLLISAALFCWLVVVPVWQVHNALHSMVEKRHGAQEAIASLGGPVEATRLLSRYIRTPWADRLSSDLLDTCSIPRKGMAGMLLTKCGDPAVDHFLGELASWNTMTRRSALQALRLMGPAAVRAVPQVTEALKDTSRDVRCSAAETLGIIGPDAREAASALEALLQDDEESVRYCSAWALGKIGDASAAPALEKLLNDNSRDVRQAAADALGRIRNPHRRIWRDGQVVELTGRVYLSRANAKYRIERSDGVHVQSVHLRGRAVDELKLGPGNKLRVKGTIKYVHVPAPKGYRGVSVLSSTPRLFPRIRVHWG
jgi:HEAT repeat protein